MIKRTDRLWKRPVFRVPVIELAFLIVAFLTTMQVKSILEVQEPLIWFIQREGLFVMPAALIQSLLLNFARVSDFKWDIALLVGGCLSLYLIRDWYHEPVLLGAYLLAFLEGSITASILTALRRVGAWLSTRKSGAQRA
ncbi:hypothetical protein HW450_05835 [Corynebacterium hindlerae]|uniref:Uncharacterized protein n=1 Tax=Corynebacterium hindlerae TaxID=699041 RepID=A0A7G5FHY5_9CORY|nr:hypothetical protein [Corynebacterium hindlerae]QMV86226.1 hypothetical protein HW450_05835 [Corynebacterium hindlerae]